MWIESRLGSNNRAGRRPPGGAERSGADHAAAGSLLHVPVPFAAGGWARAGRAASTKSNECAAKVVFGILPPPTNLGPPVRDPRRVTRRPAPLSSASARGI